MPYTTFFIGWGGLCYLNPPKPINVIRTLSLTREKQDFETCRQVIVYFLVFVLIVGFCWTSDWSLFLFWPHPSNYVWLYLDVMHCCCIVKLYLHNVFYYFCPLVGKRTMQFWQAIWCIVNEMQQVFTESSYNLIHPALITSFNWSRGGKSSLQNSPRCNWSFCAANSSLL